LVNQQYYPLFNIENKQEVLCVENLFFTEEISKIISMCESMPTSQGKVGDLQGTEIAEKRKSNINFLDGSEFKWIYDKICIAINHVNAANFNKVLYGLEPIQYSEYDAGYSGFYGMHVDVDPDTKLGMRRSLSFSMQLSDEPTYTGGELKIYYKNKTVVANKNIGDITFFDSSYPHEVTPVTSGIRKSLVGWVIGPRI
jgi:PKHD-type hydroxylase